MTNSPILFVVTSVTSYRLQLIFAKYCVAQGWKIAFVYDSPPDALYSDIKKGVSQLGGAVLSLDALIRDADEATLRRKNMPNGLRARFFYWFTSKMQSSPHFHILGARLGAAQRLLKDLSPRVVIVSEDGISGPAAMITAAQSLQLPVLDLPYGCGIQQDIETALEEKAACNELIRINGWLGCLIKWFSPGWVKKGPFAGAIIFPTQYIAICESLGMTLCNAWIIHGGYANRLFVESDQMMELYRSEQISKKKLILTGTPYCDLIHSTLQQYPQANTAFRKPLQIEPGKLRILVSWPPDYHPSRANKCEFPTYETMSQHILSWLNTLPNCHVTVSLHPAIQAEAQDAIQQLGLDISTEYVIKLIPQHDIFVTYYSSTIRWAIASGKPVVNYDAYQLKLNLYTDAPGFFNTTSFDAFKEKILELTFPETFAYYAAKQSAIAERWGIVDGKCMERIATEIHKLSPFAPAANNIVGPKNTWAYSLNIIMLAAIDPGVCNACTMHFFSIADGFAKLNHQIEIFLPRPRNNEFAIKLKNKQIKAHKKISVRYLRLPNFCIALLQTPWVLKRVIQKKYQIIYVRSHPCSFLTILLLRLLTKAKIVSEHNGWIADELTATNRPYWMAKIAKKFQYLDARFSHIIRVVTPKLGILLANNGINKNKIFCVGNGTNTSKIVPIPRNAALEFLHLDEKYFYLGFIGTLHSWQGLSFAIEALYIVKQKRPEVRLIIAGDGPELNNIKELVEMRGVEKEVYFLGNINHDQINSVLNAFDIAVAPFTLKRNLSIGLSPLKIRDYAAAGVPVIAANIPGIKHDDVDWIKTFTPEKYQELANIILDLIPQKKLLEAMGVSARAYAEKFYDWNLIAEKIMGEIYVKMSKSVLSE